MLGRYTPFYSLTFRFVPGIDLFRRPTDASFVFGFALAILVGHCLADYVREGLPRFRPLLNAIIVSVWLGIVGSAVVFSGRTGHALQAGREAGVTVAVMLIAVLILLGARQRPARLAAAILVTLIALTELLWWNAASRLNAQNRSLYAVLEAPTGPEAAAIALLETTIAADHRRGDHPRVEVLGLGGPWQNLAMVRGWEATNGYNPLRIGLYDRLVAPGEQSWAASQRQFPASFDGYDSPLAKALGLTYLVLGEPLERMTGPADSTRRRPSAEGPTGLDLSVRRCDATSALIRPDPEVRWRRDATGGPPPHRTVAVRRIGQWLVGGHSRRGVNRVITPRSYRGRRNIDERRPAGAARYLLSRLARGGRRTASIDPAGIRIVPRRRSAGRHSPRHVSLRPLFVHQSARCCECRSCAVGT